MAHWTADEFAMAARALKLGHNVSDEIMGDALRIAAHVMEPGLIEAMCSRPHNPESAHSMAAFADAIRAALTETTDV